MKISAKNLNGYLEAHDDRGRQIPRVGDVFVEIGGEILEFPHISIREIMQFFDEAVNSIKLGQNSAIILIPDFEQSIILNVSPEREFVSVSVDGLLGEVVEECVSLKELYATSVEW